MSRLRFAFAAIAALWSAPPSPPNQHPPAD